MPVKVIGRGVILQLWSTSNLQPAGQLASLDATPPDAAASGAAVRAQPAESGPAPTQAQPSAGPPRSLDLATAEASGTAVCLQLLQATWQGQIRPPQCAPPFTSPSKCINQLLYAAVVQTAASGCCRAGTGSNEVITRLGAWLWSCPASEPCMPVVATTLLEWLTHAGAVRE